MSDPVQAPEVPNRLAGLSAAGPLDLLIVGGGIVGAGLARDAALRGLRVGLVEQHDFASGTSSRSSRLLHGGLRYLAQGRIGLVREASIEKRIIHRIAPHLARPLAFLFPTYGSRVLGPWALHKLRLGVKVYDLLCGGRNLGRSSALNAEEVRRLLPGIREEGLTGAVRYYDGLTSDARLVLDTLRSAGRADALLLNYCRLEGARFDGRQWMCRLHDVLAGTVGDVAARCVVNAAGPWAQGLPNSSVRLRLTKGVHLVIDAARLPVPDAVVMAAGNRILFAIPWDDRVILGTTDTDYDGPPEAVAADDNDIDYVLDIVNTFFPAAHLESGDVISTYAGIRPLIAQKGGGPSDISRSHQIASPKPGWWDVSGGKLTTYRLMAEQTIDQVNRYLCKPASRCATARLPLLPDEMTRDVSGIAPPPVTRRVVEHYCREEWAVHLEDVIIRRTSWHLYHRDRARLAGQVSRWMAETLGWDENRRCAELRAYLGESLAAPAQPALSTTE